MNRRKFIGACACCAFLSSQAAFSNKYKDDYVVRYVEIHIAEHCNLNCKHCLHFSPIAQKEFYDLDKFRQDMKQMSSLFNKQLIELQLFGGEPLLNPEINEYVKTSRKNFRDSKITIVTNGVLLDDMSDKFWKTLNKNDVNIVPSIYPVEINWESVLKKAEKYNVGIFGDYKHTEKLTLDNIDKYCKNAFYKIKLNEKGYKKSTEEKFQCDGVDKTVLKKGFRYANMYNGKLYPCFAIAYIRHFNKKFNADFKVADDDYLDLYKVKDLNEVRRFLKKPYYPFCKYCMFESSQYKWENSAYHNKGEWT